ncbi:MAG TPA: hypothetical protein PKI96_13355 [Sedimentisphaerales bacterium]|nr:hypothetical protein [Sedimentisphaerales bacterium]
MGGGQFRHAALILSAEHLHFRHVPLEGIAVGVQQILDAVVQLVHARDFIRDDRQQVLRDRFIYHSGDMPQHESISTCNDGQSRQRDRHERQNLPFKFHSFPLESGIDADLSCRTRSHAVAVAFL